MKKETRGRKPNELTDHEQNVVRGYWSSGQGYLKIFNKMIADGHTVKKYQVRRFCNELDRRKFNCQGELGKMINKFIALPVVRG